MLTSTTTIQFACNTILGQWNNVLVRNRIMMILIPIILLITSEQVLVFGQSPSVVTSSDSTVQESYRRTYVRGRASTSSIITTTIATSSNIRSTEQISNYVSRQKSIRRVEEETSTTNDVNNETHAAITRLFHEIVAHSLKSQLLKNDTENTIVATNETSTFELDDNNTTTTNFSSTTTMSPNSTSPNNSTSANDNSWYQNEHQSGSMRFGLLFLANLVAGIVLIIIFIRAAEYIRYKWCGSSFFATARELDISRNSVHRTDAPSPPGPRIELDRGPIVAKAGLVGMTLEERSKVLPEIFDSTTFEYNSSIPLYQQVPIYNIHAPAILPACTSIHKIDATFSSAATTTTTETKSCDELESSLSIGLTLPCGGEASLVSDQEKVDDNIITSGQDSVPIVDDVLNNGDPEHPPQQDSSTPDDLTTDEKTNEDEIVVPNSIEDNRNQTPQLEPITPTDTETPTTSTSPLDTPAVDAASSIYLPRHNEHVDGQLEQSNTVDDRNDNNENDDMTIDEMEDDYIVKCPICLEKLKNGDIVMSGTQCVHVFHKQCCLEWLYKNDHCPNCRNEMFDPQEMLKGAIRILGDDRIRELNRRNFSFSQLP